MKKFKLGILCAILVISSLQVEATAEFIGNQPDKMRLSSGQNAFLETEKNHQDAKVVSMDSSGQHSLEVKTKDEPDTMTWDAAVIAVQKHGAGWRLPTIAEL